MKKNHEENEKATVERQNCYCGKCDNGYIPVFIPKQIISVERALSSRFLCEINAFRTNIPCTCNNINPERFKQLLLSQNMTPQGALTTLVLFDFLWNEKRQKGLKIQTFNPAIYFGIGDVLFDFDISLIMPLVKRSYTKIETGGFETTAEFINHYASTHRMGAN